MEEELEKLCKAAEAFQAAAKAEKWPDGVLADVEYELVGIFYHLTELRKII